MRTNESCHAGQGTERLSYPARPRNADGPVFPQLPDTVAPRRGTPAAGLPTGANPAVVRKTDRLSRHRRTARPDRGVLRPSPRLAVVRPQRGKRTALSLSRLEVRRDRPVRPYPLPTPPQHSSPAHPHDP